MGVSALPKRLDTVCGALSSSATLAATTLVMAVVLCAWVSPAAAAPELTNCNICHDSGTSHYHLSPTTKNMRCYSLCHFEGTGAWVDYLRSTHEYSESVGDDFYGSDHFTEACDFCHSPDHPLMPRHIEADVDAAHANDTADCGNCHGASLYEAHGALPACDACHASTDARVQAAIAADDASCGACHDINSTTGHPGYPTKTWSPDDYYAWNTKTDRYLSEVGDNPLYPGVHGGYTATTAKCGICHSVHRANAQGVKLLDTATATCAGCHEAGGSTVTNVLVSWQAGGPHGSGDPGACLDRSCHVGNPHGVGGSQYKIVAAKLLSPATDTALSQALSNEASSGISAANLNAEIPVSGGGWDEATRSAVRTGYTCNQAGCHVQTMLTVLERGWAEERVAAGDPAGPTVPKTGHLSFGIADARSSFSPVAGCVSCHDQTDAATAGVTYSAVSGYTFPHSQTPTGASNTGTDRAWLWMTLAGNAGGDAFAPLLQPTDKAKDGTCLKCHRDVGDRAGIGMPAAGTIVFAWTATPRSWAEYFIHDSSGNLVATGYGEYGVDGWTGTFTIRVPVSTEPYDLSIEWFDVGYDPWESHWTIDTALIDDEGSVHTVYY